MTGVTDMPRPRRHVAVRPRVPAARRRQGRAVAVQRGRGLRHRPAHRVRRRRHAPGQLTSITSRSTCGRDATWSASVDAVRACRGRSQRSRMRRSPLDAERRRVGREAAPQEQEQVGRRAPHGHVGRDAAVAPADAEDAVVGPERPRLRRPVGRHGAGPNRRCRCRRGRRGSSCPRPRAARRSRRPPARARSARACRPPAARPSGGRPSPAPAAGARTARRRGRRRSSRPQRRRRPGQRVGEGPDPGVEPVGDRRRAPAGGRSSAVRSGCAPSPRPTVAQRCTLPTWPTSRATSQPGQACHGGIERAGVRHRRERLGPPCETVAT